MELLMKEISFDSCACDERIFVRVVEPADKLHTRGVLQIAHGMAEHSLLYLDFANYMARAGFAVAINDHLGHGKSVSKGGAFGYFGEGGAQNLVRDMHKLYSLMHAEYPKAPYFLMGHSMGSFLARSYAAQFGNELTAAVFMGTCGPQNRMVFAAERKLADRMVDKFGAKSHHPLFSRMSIERFNKAFAPNRTPSDWVTRDEAEVDRYVADPLCGFDFTVSGYRDVVYLQSEVTSDDWLRRLPKTLPVLLISGDQDPLGDFGKGIRRLLTRLQETGHDAEMILYPGARHALITETNRDEVYRDLLSYLEKHFLRLDKE
ncbi:alpha/beta fold hydrolase [Anaeromassilibacillus sp. An200]|nr:alpha/beta fold hydrolase [Anaeromassilibacillus sp. An200]